MRKIISKEIEEKKKKRNQFIIGGILILVMIASSIGYAFTRENSNSNPQVIYDGYTFTKTNGFWNTNIGNAQFSFTYSPRDIQKTNSMLNPISNYANKPLYIYSENAEASTEVYRNLFYQNKIVQRVQDACLQEENCTNNAPLKTCQDNFIIIKKGTTGISQQNNCVFISGSQENLTKLSDSFLFKVIGI